MEREYKPGNVEKAFKDGFKEIRNHKNGKKKLKSLEECKKEWEELSND